MKVRQREGGDGLKEIRQGHKGHFPWPVHAGEVSLLATSKWQIYITVYSLCGKFVVAKTKLATGQVPLARIGNF